MKYHIRFLRYGLYTLLVLPLVFTPFTQHPWQFGKSIIFQIVVELLFVIGFYAVLNGKKYTLPQLNWLDLGILAFVGALFLSALFGVNFANSFWTTQMRVDGVFLWINMCLFYFLLRVFLRTRMNWQTALHAVLAVSVLVSLTAVFQNYLPRTWLGNGLGKFAGIIGNSAHLALYLVIPITLAIYLALREAALLRKILYGAVALGELAVLFFTESRGAFVGIAAALFVVCAVSCIVLQEKKSRIIAFSALIALVAVLSILFFSRAPSGALDISSYITSGTARTRIMAWSIASQGIRERPILGWGKNNFEVFFNSHFNPEFLRFGFTETIWDRPHNWFLDIAFSSGIIGTIAYGAIIASLIAYLWRMMKNAPDDAVRMQYLALLGGLIAYASALMFLFETFNSLLLFIAFCAFVSFLRIAHSEEQKIYVLHEAKKWKKEFLIAISVLAVIISIFKWNIKPLNASYYLQKSSMDIFARKDMADWARDAQAALAASTYLNTENAILLASDIATADKRGIQIGSGGVEAQSALEAIGQILANAASQHKNNYVYAVWAGQTYLALGTNFGGLHIDDAIKWFEEAARRAPQKQEVYFFLGRAYLVKRDFTKGEEALREAVRLSPDLGEPYWFLGLLQIAAGNTVEGLKNAEEAFAKSSGLKSIKSVLYIIDAYAREKRYDKAIEYYIYLTKLEPSNAVWYTRLAASYVQMGDKQKARDAVEKAVSLESELRGQADVFMRQNKLYDKKK